MFTQGQQQALVQALRSETNATVVAAIAARNDTQLLSWCNDLSTADAWSDAMDSKSLFQAADITKFDNLTAGKRDAYRMMLDYAPHDMSKNANRKAVLDIWGVTDSVPVLQACVRKATRAETYIGGTVAATNGVSALKLSWSGKVDLETLSTALNTY